MQWSYPELRRRLIEAELWPQGRMARITCYILALGAGLFALEKLLGLLTPWHDYLGGWVIFLVILWIILSTILTFRWLKKRMLWRLRNRLIVTYVFIGVIPAILLFAMEMVTLYGLAGQFAVFVLTSEIHSQLRSLEAVNAAVTNELAAHLERGDGAASESLAGLKKRDPAWGHRRICAWYKDKTLAMCDEAKDEALIVPTFVKGRFADIVRDRDALHLRVATTLALSSGRLTVITSEPFDKELVGNIAADLGEITLYPTAQLDQPNKSKEPAANQTTGKNRVDFSTGQQKNGSGVTLTQSKSNGQTEQQELRPTFTVGEMPEQSSAVDREITFATPLSVVDWKTGDPNRFGALIKVRTRPLVLYSHLFAALGEFVQGVEYILLAVAVILGIIELIALFIGTRMTRTVTLAVAQLHEATKFIDRGEFSHRIPIRSRDQLSELARSFNSMTASIEKLILEQKEKQRLEGELAIAQEVQDQLFPRQVSGLESLEVHGFCRPARTVSGDYYDFLSANSDRMILAVGDISGKGISAALLMATIHSAVRAYSVESLTQLQVPEPVIVGAVAGSGRMMAAWPQGIEVSPSMLLRLLNHQLYESTPPEKYATLFLGVYEGNSRRLTYSNGGHLPPILIGESGAIRRLEAGGTVVGLFDDVPYDEGSVVMHRGEVFIAYSDGVTEPENDFGEFGEARLIELVRDNRHLPLEQISQIVTSAVDTWIGDNEQPDDVTLVLARPR
jgi:sigma-B regulation protein RsbU (phosphoserine phosphatase)